MGYGWTTAGAGLHDPGGCGRFGIDRSAGILRCPAGYAAQITSSDRASFTSHCPCCPLRRRCTTAKGGRTIHLHPHEEELRAAHRRATTRSFQERYRRWRPMAERSIAWLVADGCRRAPYRGIDRNDLWWSLRVTAVNLRRLLALGLARRDQRWVWPAGTGKHPGSPAPGTNARHAMLPTSRRTTA